MHQHHQMDLQKLFLFATGQKNPFFKLTGWADVDAEAKKQFMKW